jgi:hypothetical protein
MKKPLTLALALLLVLAAIYLGSPLYAVHTLQKAAVAGDVDRIAAGVDFPAVREGLKPQVAAAIEGRLPRDLEASDDPIEAVGRLLAPSLADVAVDRFVTPRGIATLMRGHRPSDRDRHEANPDMDRKAGYVGLNHFRVRLRNKRRSEDGPIFLFERRGFASWKLVRVDLPPRWLDPRAPR